MRLSSCVALELLTLAGTGLSAATGLFWLTGELHLREAQAAVARVEPVPALERPRPPVFVAAAAREPELQWQGPLATGTFEGIDDQELLEPLLEGELATVAVNRGGSSLSLRVTFDNGAMAAFKPRQTNLQTVPRKEVAAYRVSRLVGLSSVQPAVGRAFPANALRTALRSSDAYHRERLRTEMLVEDGMVVGELSWWIPEIRTARFDGIDVDTADGIVSWRRKLAIGGRFTADEGRLLAQISNLLVFDYLINNSDRWSGGNTRASVDRKRIYFMDNTLSFSPLPDADRKAWLYLEKTQTFSRGLIARVRSLDFGMVRTALNERLGPFDYLLTVDELEAMAARRDRLVEHVDALIAEHGEERVLVFP